jgi:hypothetical protein
MPPLNAGKPRPQTYLVSHGTGFHRESCIVSAYDSQDVPGRPATQHKRAAAVAEAVAPAPGRVSNACTRHRPRCAAITRHDHVLLQVRVGAGGAPGLARRGHSQLSRKDSVCASGVCDTQL